jgi:acyl carrier protein
MTNRDRKGKNRICWPASGKKTPGSTLRTSYLVVQRVDMISPSDARLRVQENLTGFPKSVVDAYLGFADTGDPDRLDDVVLGVLQFYLAKPPPASLTTFPASTRLIADLGCDSLTMIDVMFLAESLLGIKLADDELVKVETLGELREHFRRRLAEADQPSA